MRGVGLLVGVQPPGQPPSQPTHPPDHPPRHPPSHPPRHRYSRLLRLRHGSSFGENKTWSGSSGCYRGICRCWRQDDGAPECTRPYHLMFSGHATLHTGRQQPRGAGVINHPCRVADTSRGHGAAFGPESVQAKPCGAPSPLFQPTTPNPTPHAAQEGSS